MADTYVGTVKKSDGRAFEVHWNGSDVFIKELVLTWGGLNDRAGSASSKGEAMAVAESFVRYK